MGDNFHPQDNQIPVDEGSGVSHEQVVDNPVVVDDAAAAGLAAAETVHPTDPSAGTATAAALVNANQIPPQPVDASVAGVLGATPVDHGCGAPQAQEHQQVQLQQVPVQVQHYVEAVDANTHAQMATGATVDGETLHIEIPMPKVENEDNGVTVVHHHGHQVTQDPHDETTDPTGAMEAMPALTIPNTPGQSMPDVVPVYTHQITAATAGLSAAASSLIATPSKPSTKQERMDAIWMKHYKELQEYKAQHGHVRVPRKSGPLGEWVRTQRRYYKLWRRGESVPLTKERMELLDHLGFVWLPAEEKVGGGFRGGRPKKRKREEEDALAAANAAAAAAAVAAGGHTNPAFFHHLASPATLSVANSALDGMEAAEGTHEGTMTPHGGEGNEEDEGTDAPVDENGELIEGENPTDAAAAMANIHGVGIPGMPVPMPVYTYHHDPFHFQSMSKRSDIANQINMLNNGQSLNRQLHNQQGPKVEYATEGLSNAHAHYDDVVYVLKRSNEELRDAELALDRAKKTYDQAQALKDKADALLANASEEVLNAELEDGNDEWIAMYKCLVKYKQENGNILFPRLSGIEKSNGKSGSSTSADEDVAVEDATISTSSVSYGKVGVDEQGEIVGIANTVSASDAEATEGCTNKDTPENADAETAAPQDVATGKQEGETKTDEQIREDAAISVADAVAAATAVPMEGVTNETADREEVKKEDEHEATDVDPSSAEGTAPGEEKTEAIDGAEATGETKGGDTVAPALGTTLVHGAVATGTIDVTETVLHDWVSKMRKFPKKQFKKWRRHALDKLGFVWHQYNATWTDRYRELVEFRNQHGHTVVPTSNSNLGIWVGTQRKQYRLMQQGKPSHMTLERVEMLNEIDFVWHVNTWNERYEELKAFKEQFGHFLVPTDYQNKQLRPWITTQRSHYRFLQEGKSSQLTDERIEMLDKIGFPWKTREDWQTRYQELVLFIEENGNCAVPRNYNRFPKLYRWVNCQRMEYQKYTEGSASRLKADQISLLENVGFE